MSFAHLHVHSQYSLLESSCRFSQTCKMAADFGMPAIANTDLGNMFGAIEFYFAAKKHGVKPIIGMEAFLAPYGHLEKNEVNGVKKPNTRIVLLAKNINGYNNLCLLYTSPSPRDATLSRMPSSA